MPFYSLSWRGSQCLVNDSFFVRSCFLFFSKLSELPELSESVKLYELYEGGGYIGYLEEVMEQIIEEIPIYENAKII